MSTQLSITAPPEADSEAAALAKDLAALTRLDSINSLLSTLCKATGMTLIAIVRAGTQGGAVCAVMDDGSRTRFRQATHTPSTLEYLRKWKSEAATDESRNPYMQSIQGAAATAIESQARATVRLPDGRLFGEIRGVRTGPATVILPAAGSLFQVFADHIGLLLHQELRQGTETVALLDERAASELREQFIAILGHDLRDPLQAISSIGELLERRTTDPGTAQLAARMRSSTRRMSALIDDILDFARTRLGSGLGMDMRDTNDLDQALTAVSRELQDGHESRRISTHIAIGRTVRCDVGRLQQLVSNLIGNALKHGFKDSTVRFSATADEEYLVLEVWNDGVPIPAELVDTLFQPFWRNPLNRHRDGLGLGLDICRQIVSAHHGMVTVRSEPAFGTKFTVRLPLNAEHPSTRMVRLV
jgi:signal transduction histidine kinase